MKVLSIIGADLSKDSIDLFCHDQQTHLKIDNNATGFNALVGWLKQQGIALPQAMIVMEHTGRCSYHLEAFLHRKHVFFAKVAALTIKRSLGLVRGKNDHIDARRIARFGFEKRDLLVAALKADPALERLQMLYAARKTLVRHCASLKCSLKEYGRILQASDPLVKAMATSVDALTTQIKKLEAQIEQLLRSSEPLCRTFKLLKSVIGVGPIVATATIVKTGNFTRFDNSRKFCCYCGTAPFEHRSGTSIRKKTKISHLADKDMKTLLTQAAKTALQHDPEIKQYYLRRQQMGKNNSSTINVIKTKIIARMFAVIKRQTPFEKQYFRTA